MNNSLFFKSHTEIEKYNHKSLPKVQIFYVLFGTFDVLFIRILAFILN